MRSRSPTRKTESGGVFFWRINQAQYSGAGACAEKIVLSVLEKFGLCRSSEAAGLLRRSRLIWANCFEPKLWATAGHCLINHFPRSVELTHKHRLCETLTRCRSRYLPRSFVLPQEDALWHQSLQDMGRPGGHDAISGNIKARYEDFVVKEISHEGEIVESCREGGMSSDFKALQAATGSHARLVLAKENRDVADAVAMLARHLQIDARKVSFHGLKDRRAVTYQHISVPWALLDEKRLASSMSLSTWDPAVHISRLERQDVHCRMGWMRGNDFCIVVRDAQPAQGLASCAAGKAKFRSLVEEASRSLRTLGFVNYFGRQRFGPSACGPAIGRAIASGHHETACELLVCSMRSARNREIEEFFARGEFRRALAETPARCAVERRVLQHLCISPADYSGALGSLPRRQRLLFARSFASLLWNQVVSARLAAFGQEVFAGDLVLASREVGLHNAVAHRAKGMRPDVSLPEVRVVRPGEQRDIPFSDIVLPVPGDRCTYPAHPPTRRLYAQVLQGNDFPQSASSEAEQSYLEGTYRHAVVTPLAFRARTMGYVEPCSRLVVSALDHIKGRSLEPHGMFELSCDATTTEDVRSPLTDAGQAHANVCTAVTRISHAGVFGTHWIMKPGRGGGGRGVQVLSCQSAAHIQQAIAMVKSSSSAKTPVVVSQYVEKPLLIDGKKCDLRLYVLVTSFGRTAAHEECQVADRVAGSADLTAYIFSEGLVRFASEPFAMSCESLGNSCIHLTNNEARDPNSSS
eukprot:s1686_g2.t4